MIINMTGSFKPEDQTVYNDKYASTSGSSSYADGKTITITPGFTPMLAYGYAKIKSTVSRMIAGGINGYGYKNLSDATISSNMSFTFGSSYVSFAPNGTGGTCYWYVAGTR